MGSIADAANLTSPSAEERVRVASAGASPADLKAFRRNLRLHGGPPTSRPRIARIRNILAQPSELRRLATAAAHHGPHVEGTEGVSPARHRSRLVSAYLHGVPSSDFYFYRIYRDDQYSQKHRHFGFSRVLRLQQALIDSYDSPDYEFLAKKHLFAERCMAIGLPTVPLIASFEDGVIISHQSRLPQADLFSKPSDLMIGLGTTLWRWRERGLYSSPAAPEPLDGPALLGWLARDSQGSSRLGPRRLLLQEKVSNHSEMLGRLTAGGLSTVRLVSCLAPSGSFDLMPPVIRMPVGDAIADNIAQGGLAAPIDVVTGRICGPAIRKDKTCGVLTFDRHPTTGVALDGFRLPFWPEVVELALGAHRAFSGVQFVGWDVAILEDQPVLLEGNAWWDVDLTIVPHNITLSDTQFIPYYNYHFARRPTTRP